MCMCVCVYAYIYIYERENIYTSSLYIYTTPIYMYIYVYERIIYMRVCIYTYVYLLQDGFRGGFHPRSRERGGGGRVKGADAGTRVGERRLCWRREG